MAGYILTPITSMSGPRPNSDSIVQSYMFDSICRVSAHEVGHALGLVDTYYLDGVEGSHNPGPDDQTKMMNISTDLGYMFNSHSPIGWRTLNSRYLEFVLPIPK